MMARGDYRKPLLQMQKVMSSASVPSVSCHFPFSALCLQLLDMIVISFFLL